MTLDEKIKALKAKLEGQRSKVTALQTEVRSLAEKAENEADFTAAKAKRSELDNLNKEIRMNEENLDLYKEALRGKTKPAAKRNKVEANKEQRHAINEYIRSKGKITEGVEIRDGEAVIPGEMLRDITPTTDGISSPDAKPVIPVAISYTPQRELQTSVDLKQFTNVFAATTASGQYPILKNTTATLISVAELEKNPALAKPEFANVDWKIQTYRGAIPLSQESIDDAVVDLVGIVGENANQQKQNTTNGAVATVMKGFTAKSVNTLDDLKHINNVDLDPAYERVIVATQSFYNWLDTLKDGNGRYLLQDSIVSPSGKTVLNMPIFVIADTLFGVAGEAHAFIGDVKRAVIFANRSDVTVRWVDSEIYGQYLQVATRFDAKPADKKAGFFLTYTDEAAPKA
ncbi:phage major capsid protein [Loigolactobacillus coryniformis]|uniref:Major capsid protein n=1 Tax=Loigolactobacillus coryniformis subsp. torquens DSM 20004 = KCTC 3535 TaxID=1423822 RepID=A0A2D1KMT6_9LACO|nr:phage major capsid protein [Loigolactobacillus coryniformis]ATO43408.1 major capsid protein [Loigolactobacillus coryniformis subsp. torquens DSM 20004 = KCTC 3535]KRK85509.1 phage-related major head protein [Loigolactobacillus coryniformis subsp. torquens DSM 20004 = KCTC 3535]